MQEMDFVRGDLNVHTFAIPTANWSAGGRLFFAAKSAVDDDTTDGAALIVGNWDDTSGTVTDVTINGVAYKKYICKFQPAATSGIPSSGATSVDLLGEWQWVSSAGVPASYPGPSDDKIPVKVYMDIVRKTTP